MTQPVTAAFRLQSAIRGLLADWPGLAGVDVSTGPRRKALQEGIVVARPRATSAYRGAYRSEDGSIAVMADAFKPGAGEDAIDAARDRAEELITEVVAGLSPYAQTGGDVTVDGVVLAIGTEITFEELDNYLEDEGQRLKGHGYTIGATFTYTARFVTGDAT